MVGLGIDLNAVFWQDWIENLQFEVTVVIVAETRM